MDYKKIQARNKFVNKITNKIDKLNQDIKLLLEVDQALNIQVGGTLLGDVATAMNNIKTPTTTGTPIITNEAFTTAANQLAKELSEKIDILEKTLKTLLEHISRYNPTVDLTGQKITVNDSTMLDPLKVINTSLQTKFEPEKLKKFNELHDKYSKGDLSQPAQQAAYKRAINEAFTGSNDIMKLLHDTIMSSRKSKNVNTFNVTFP